MATEKDSVGIGTTAILAATAGLIGAVMVARQRRRINLKGKTVLLTGGSRGLGLALARKLAAEGARIAICARDADELKRAEADILAAKPDAVVRTFPVDLFDPAQIERLVSDTQREFGPIDVLIHNAGIIQVGPMDTMTQSDFEEAMKLHFWAAYHLVQAALPSMRARRSGRIAFISSIGGKVSVPHLLPYSVSKFALVGYGEGLRAELNRDGVYVTTVCPGLMRTGSPKNALFKGQNSKEYAWFTLSDSIPGLSISADTAASEIIAAVEHGDAEAVLSLPAKVAMWAHGLAPGITVDLMGQVTRLLPETGGIGTERRPGSESQRTIAPSILTALTEIAARRNNEE